MLEVNRWERRSAGGHRANGVQQWSGARRKYLFTACIHSFLVVIHLHSRVNTQRYETGLNTGEGDLMWKDENCMNVSCRLS